MPDLVPGEREEHGIAGWVVADLADELDATARRRLRPRDRGRQTGDVGVRALPLEPRCPDDGDHAASLLDEADALEVEQVVRR